MKVMEQDWNTVLKCFDRYTKSYMFHNDGAEPDIVVEFQDIVDDINLAQQEGHNYIYVDVDTMKAFAELGVISEEMF